MAPIKERHCHRRPRRHLTAEPPLTAPRGAHLVGLAARSPARRRPGPGRHPPGCTRGCPCRATSVGSTSRRGAVAEAAPAGGAPRRAGRRAAAPAEAAGAEARRGGRPQGSPARYRHFHQLQPKPGSRQRPRVLARLEWAREAEELRSRLPWRVHGGRAILRLQRGAARRTSGTRREETQWRGTRVCWKVPCPEDSALDPASRRCTMAAQSSAAGRRRRRHSEAAEDGSPSATSPHPCQLPAAALSPQSVAALVAASLAVH
mmetsp:Transcript_167653/g.538499  ORF Transcript_167653/g.538499 Transcript_167653/m.538499 type:complete len:261 (+) Transcript_167653:841-1623(+)